MGKIKLTERKAYMELIRAYRDHSFLWNKKNPEFFNRQLKLETLEKLSSILRPSVSDADGKLVSQKMKKFKASFIREHRKVVKRKKAGVNYVPIHWAYWEMSFLKDVLESPDQISEDRDSPTPKLVAPNVSTSHRMGQSLVSELPPLLPLVPAPQSSSGERPATVVNSSEGSDHCDTFLQLIAIKLKELGPQQRLYAEKIINDTLFYAETGELTFDQLSCIENALKNRNKS
uniref:MADF domain-containing protein n=1 Tax=Anopheles atroparvus TaxID=41427 RepID=A0AAG5DNH4_ANOAO